MPARNMSGSFNQKGESVERKREVRHSMHLFAPLLPLQRSPWECAGAAGRSFFGEVGHRRVCAFLIRLNEVDRTIARNGLVGV